MVCMGAISGVARDSRERYNLRIDPDGAIVLTLTVCGVPSTASATLRPSLLDVAELRRRAEAGRTWLLSRLDSLANEASRMSRGSQLRRVSRLFRPSELHPPLAVTPLSGARRLEALSSRLTVRRCCWESLPAVASRSTFPTPRRKPVILRTTSSLILRLSR